jgi:hypothetical protein
MGHALLFSSECVLREVKTLDGLPQGVKPPRGANLVPTPIQVAFQQVIGRLASGKAQPAQLKLLDIAIDHRRQARGAHIIFHRQRQQRHLRARDSSYVLADRSSFVTLPLSLRDGIAPSPMTSTFLLDCVTVSKARIQVVARA